MKTLVLILFLPAIVIAGINIEIIASDADSQRRVQCEGNFISVISDLEILTFRLSDDNLKAAVETSLGNKPDDVFLKSPTPWGDLYVTNEWKQVSRILKPANATILSITSHPTTVLKQNYNNIGTEPEVFKAKMWQNVQNTVASFWDRSAGLSVPKDIHYKIEIKAMAVSVEAKFNYKSKWGQNVVKSQTVTVGSDIELEIPLEPDQSVVAELIATKRSMSVKINYIASLTGSVAMNFAEMYKDHHFWSIDINKVLMTAGLAKKFLSSEVIDIGFYSDAKVIVSDNDTHEVIKVLNLRVF